jgi:hypothetical protein
VVPIISLEPELVYAILTAMRKAELMQLSAGRPASHFQSLDEGR